MSAGRKRTFNKVEALDKATRVFWENGYSGTSISDLTEALGINKPSLYAAFGNKESLFDAAIEHYLSEYQSPMLLKLTDSPKMSLRFRIKAMLMVGVETVSSPTNPKGCLFVKSCYEAGSHALPEKTTALIGNLNSKYERTLTDLLTLEKDRGNIPEHVDTALLTAYLLSVMAGVSVLAKSGKSGKQLEPIVDLALANLAWLDS